MKYFNYLLPISLVFYQVSFADEDKKQANTTNPNVSISKSQPYRQETKAPSHKLKQKTKANVAHPKTIKKPVSAAQKKLTAQPKSQQQAPISAVEIEESENKMELIVAVETQQECNEQENNFIFVQNEQTSNPPSPPVLKNCEHVYHVMHVSVRHTEAQGVGYSDGYTTLEGFGIYNRHTSFMPFLDLRGHVFDNGKFAGNIGIGGRSWFSSINHTLGYYLYYDIRQDQHHLTPQQLGPGIELLGKRMEYRINGYFPVGEAESHKYDFVFDSFNGHRILLKYKQRRVMTGGDAELGVHITQSTKYDVYAGAGPYYFSASNASAWGGKVRLLGRYKQYVSLEASYSYDHLFRNIVQGSVALNIPFGKKLKYKNEECSPQRDLALSRVTFAPYRFEIPVVKRIRRRQNAINPSTGDPWKVWFVKNTSSSNGTFKSPFPTLLQAQNASGPNDMIYVFRGDGTTNGMNMGITLKDKQVLFGSGISHHFSTTNGTVKIPEFTSSYPTISNTTGSVVNLANGNEVSGFNIWMTMTGAYGIDGGAGVKGADINHNLLFGNVDYRGMRIVARGTVDIKHNHLVNSISMANFRGIAVSVIDEKFMDADISHNEVSGFQDFGIFFGPNANPTTASAKATISSNTVSNYGMGGIFYGTGMPNAIVKITKNMVIDNTGIVTGGVSVPQGAIVASVNNAPDSGKVIIDRNTVLTTTTNAQQLGINAQINLPTGAHVNAIITNNTVFTGSGADSVGLSLFSRGDMCASVSGNKIHAQAAGGTTDLNISTAGGTAIINLDDLSGNIAEDITISGNVQLVSKGTCGE